MNALEKMVDLLAAFALLFLIPLLYYGSGKRMSQAMLAGQAGEHFLNTASTAGEITLPVWTEFENALERFGCEQYEIQRERYLFEPGQEIGTVIERVYIERKDALWETVKDEGRSRLRKGDRIKLTLYVNEIPAVYYETIRTGATGG